MRNNSHRYTNLADFNEHVKSRIKIDDDKFELIETEKDEDDRFEEDHVKFLREEDEIIQALQVCSSKSFLNFIPEKDSSQLMNELNKEGIMKTLNGKAVFYCKRHPEKKANFICVNKCCEYTLYCMSCRKNHAKECNRKEMFMNINQIEKKDFMDEYFDVHEFKYDEKINKVKEFVETQREKMSEMLNVFEKILVNKIKLQSKEFKLKQIKDLIEDAHRKFEGKGAANRRRAVTSEHLQLGDAELQVPEHGRNGPIQVGGRSHRRGPESAQEFRREIRKCDE